MKKKKINEISPNKKYEGSCSDLYTRYKAAYDKILRLNDAKFNSEKYKEFYIADEELDRELSQIQEDVTDTLSVLIGYCGIGKSTSLRNFFGFGNSAPVIHEKQKTLIFPSVFNGDVEEDDQSPTLFSNKGEFAKKIKSDMALRIDSVCTFLEKNFKGLRELFYSEEGQREFYEYLSETNPRVLEHLPYSERIGLSEMEDIKKRLEYAYREEQFIFATTKLKYYLGKNICGCNRIIVILDDIEPLPYSAQLELVLQYARFFECMKNTAKRIEEKEYLVNILISMRPHTYRILKEHRAFQAFYVNRVILKRNMVDLGALFRKKVEFYKNSIRHEKEEPWDAANRALNILTTKFQSKFSTMIQNLSILDTREAIKIYERVLENRIWIQRNIDKTASFVISKDNYIFNNITVLRAIACGHRCVYDSSKSDVVPNILYTTETKNYYFPILCIFTHYFKDSDIDYVYGMASKTYHALTEAFVSSFPGMQEIQSTVEAAIWHAFRTKLLRKSINDTDKPETLDTKESLKDSSQLYLSPRGVEIWQMVASDSVYMELCREDYYRDYDNKENNPNSSYELLVKGEQGRIFEDLLRILMELLDEEYKYVSYSQQHGTIDIYKRYFGDESICQRFYTGIRNSIEFSGHQDYGNIRRICREVTEKVRKIEDMLQ